MAITGSTPSNTAEKLEINIEFFAVRSKDGKYFRSVGYSGRSNWVDDIKKAKIYPKIGGARGRVTWFATHFPTYGVPEIIKITANEAVILDEGKRVETTIKKKEEKELKRQKQQALRNLKAAEADFARAAKNLENRKKEIL